MYHNIQDSGQSIKLINLETYREEGGVPSRLGAHPHHRSLSRDNELLTHWNITWTRTNCCATVNFLFEKVGGMGRKKMRGN